MHRSAAVLTYGSSLTAVLHLGQCGIYSRYLHGAWTRKQSFFFFLFRATHEAFGSSQARGQIGGAAVGLPSSHSNMGSVLSVTHAVVFSDAGSFTH